MGPKSIATKVFEVPTLYGDHHVIEVRRILLETPGVIDAYVSSAFHVIEVIYDPDQINDLQISLRLDEAGYLGEWTAPIEAGDPAKAVEGSVPANRHTTVYEATRQVVSFAHNVSYSGRPLWPCPGMGVVRGMDEEN